ncbi:bestrophin-4 [Drosophila persimilis]|uniref:Bestrophin homolog n=1 Tax=Drosophila pseudoobscura pseudoobscura TaxID=46245 RepID=A0A6I8UCD0_DROPS|nr:bestrophin-4 [Drosophila pseudoobscura]XP_002022209.2 bestrophin-4 [Drosophila persimilis]
MTVSYTAEVASCRHFGCFWKLLARWRASIYKIIWVDLLAFLASFYCMALLYRYVLRESDKVIFEDIVVYCHSYGTLIPLSFVLGFYVSIIVDRWWNQYITVPWPDPLAVYVSALVRGQDEHGRLMRRTIMRYVCLALTMVLTMISPVIKRRFPNYDYLIEAGLLNANEANIIKAMDAKFPKHPKYWMPIMWASSIVTRARKEGRIWDDFSLKSMIDELNKFRAGCNMLIHYDTISVPLVYTQVVTLAVYTYFMAAIFGHQWIDKQSGGESRYRNVINYYFPLFSTLEFFFFMGWLKVAETLICPFGDDDDDFELNWLIDRNLQVSYLIVDEMHNDHPELVRDQYWDEVFPNELPYAAEAQRAEHPEASTARMDLSKINTLTTAPYKAHSVDLEPDWTDFDDEDENELRIRFAPHEIHPSRSSVSISVSSDEHFSRFEEDLGEEEHLSRETSKDDFARLKAERERERMTRQIHHAAMTLELMKGEAPAGTSSGGASEQDNGRQTRKDTEIQTDKSHISKKKDK